MMEYIPGKTWVHRTDPRVKLILLLAAILSLISFDDPVVNFSLAAFFLGIVATAHLGGKYWLSFALPLVPTFILFSVLNFIAMTAHPSFFMATSEPKLLFHVMGAPVYVEGLLYVLNVIFKFGGIILLSRSVLAITPPRELVVGLSQLKVPAEFCVATSIGMAYVPVLIGEMRTIIQAMQARGKRMNYRNPIRRARALVPLLLPSLVSSVHRSQRIAATLEARGFTYDVGKRTSAREIALTGTDVFLLVVLVLIAVGSLVLGRWGMHMGGIDYRVSWLLLGLFQKMLGH